jgi:NAD(P)-dependent dehydrogenase (short-subunit alcohol dehydrogenase family)
MNEFQGKVALVTGGTSGIGRAAAIAYAREGAKVVVAGRRAAEGEETVRLVRAQGREALFVPTDVAQETQVKNLIGRTLEKFGRLDFACNNAGIDQVPTPFLEQTVKTYDQVMDINVKGVWLSMRHEIPAMLKSGGGAIVNTSSALGVIAFPGVEVYVASKHAVIGLTKSAAVEFGKQGIRINAVLPAAIETDMYRRFVGENAESKAAMTAMHPIGRIGTPEEIADAVIWLSSSKIHLVLSDRTRGLVGAAELQAMKPSARLINTSRGPIVDEPALIEVLRQRRIAGAALDVFDIEPLPADHPFRSLDNVLATPHIGYVAQDLYRTFYGDTVKNIVRWLAQRPEA